MLPTSRLCRHASIALILAVLLVSAVTTLTGCNTTAGFGQDVSGAGHAISNSANDVKNKL
jgi:predicted small secreted protein